MWSLGVLEKKDEYLEPILIHLEQMDQTLN